MPQHIKRLIITFVVFIALFLGVRYLLVPRSFGEYGHYRGKALSENADRPFHYGGTASCTKCHADIVADKSHGHHAGLACEGCHGPGYKHAVYADSAHKVKLADSLILKRDSTRLFCAVCHEKNAARIKMVSDTINKSYIKYIIEKKHNHLFDKETHKLLNCIDCHNPHDP
jgi:hypothetical protein